MEIFYFEYLAEAWSFIFSYGVAYGLPFCAGLALGAIFYMIAFEKDDAIA